MAVGPGKYDDLATYVRKQSQAQGVVVIVVGGNKGSGFSVQLTPGVLLPLPTLLRTIADDIERDTPRA
jgi:hypothetical protein